MPLDAVCLAALCKELKADLIGAKIDKIQQPERDLLLFSIRCSSGNKKLLIAAGSGNARAHFTQQSFENPAEPPMFCMLLRKHLLGARIRELTQPNHERLLIIELDARDEMGDLSGRKLVLEMMGKNSNVVLVGSDGRILDCMRRLSYAGDAQRSLLPGMIYRLPPSQDKLDFLSSSSVERGELLSGHSPEQPMDRWLLDHFSGLSPLVCRELTYRVGEDWSRLPAQLDALSEMIEAGEAAPYLLQEADQPKDFCYLPLRQYGSDYHNVAMESWSLLLDEFYAKRERLERQKRHSHDLLHQVRTMRDRQQRKLSNQKTDLAKTEGRGELLKQAELLTANLYQVKKGQTEVFCEDYYEDDQPLLRIPLDPLKTPQQNAAAKFKEYHKLKTAEEHLTRLIEDGQKQLEYLNSVLDQLERAQTEKDLADIRRELTATGYLRRQKGSKPERVKTQSPLRYRSDDGLEILVGRNNLQNDELTLKIARRTDYWLHTQMIHGSHVIVRCEGEEPPRQTLEQAASLAVYHSQARSGGKVPVDYTMVRFVKKPSGALPGMVIYTDQRTLAAEADEELAARLLVK